MLPHCHHTCRRLALVAGLLYHGASVPQEGLQPHISIEKAVSEAFSAAKQVPNHTIRGMTVRFVPDGKELLKGYRGNIPSKVKENRPYWDVRFDYYKNGSTRTEFGGRIYIDAISGDKVN
jgi:hypothetical protein